MSAFDTFIALDRAGLSICERDGQLVIWPAASMTNELRALARKHKSDLIALARDSADRAVVALENARRSAGDAQRLHSASGDRP